MNKKTGTPTLPEMAEQMLKLMAMGEKVIINTHSFGLAIAMEKAGERRRLAVGRRDRLPTPEEVETISEAFGLVDVAWDRMATGKSMYKCMECRWRELEAVSA